MSNVWAMNGKATKYANCVDDVTGDENIAEMWKNNFAGLYNSVNDRGFKNIFDPVKNSCNSDRFIISHLSPTGYNTS